MKNIFLLNILICFGLFTCIDAKAQGNTNSKTYTKPTQIIGKEIGLRVNKHSDLSFTYLKYKNDQKAFRLRFFNTGFRFVQGATGSKEHFAVSTGIATGFLKVKSLDNKFNYYRGWEPFVGGYTSLRNFGVYAGIGYVFGLNYDLSDKFNINLELAPNFGFGMTQYHTGSDRQFIFANSSSGISIGLNYKL